VHQTLSIMVRKKFPWFQVSNLFAREEMDEILQDLTPIMKKEFGRRSSTIENLQEYFLSRTRRNLHVALCFSPVNYSCSVTNRTRFYFFTYLRTCTYGTLRHGTLRIDAYGSTVRYGFLRYVTLRYVRVENRHEWACSHTVYVGRS